MEPSKNRRCPHYQMYSEPLEIKGPPAYLVVRRCLLTERMIRLIQQKPAGAAMARKLVVRMGNGNAYAFVGPDLEAVTQRTCTLQRCEEQCTPAYQRQLELLEIGDPREEEVTCEEESGMEVKEERDVATDAATRDVLTVVVPCARESE